MKVTSATTYQLSVEELNTAIAIYFRIAKNKSIGQLTNLVPVTTSEEYPISNTESDYREVFSGVKFTSTTEEEL